MSKEGGLSSTVSGLSSHVARIQAIRKAVHSGECSII